MTGPVIKEKSAPSEKWCSGHCGRLLPLDSFYRNGDGHVNGECKACHRVSARGQYQVASRRPGFLKARRAREARRYATDAEYAEKKRQSVHIQQEIAPPTRQERVKVGYADMERT